MNDKKTTLTEKLLTRIKFLFITMPNIVQRTGTQKFELVLFS